MGILEGKNILVTGVTMRTSIAYAAVEIAQREGANVVVSAAGRAVAPATRAISKLDPAPPIVEVDVTNPEHLAALPGLLSEHFDGGLDGIVHSIAYADPEKALGGAFLTTDWDSVGNALHISAYSLQSLTMAAKPILNRGASVVGLTFDARVSWPTYDWMGVAKAALESTSRYLARYLGFPLVEGQDLTVRGDTVYLKTLRGLKRVHVILRRQDDGYCDPLELRGDSALGVPGLLGVVRAGRVVMANALGSGLLGSGALMGFLPAICERLLGEPLAMPSVATWWCGEKPALDYVKEHFDDLVIKPAYPTQHMDPVFGNELRGEARADMLRRLEARPHAYVAQEMVNLSQAPTWSRDHERRLIARPVGLRAYAAVDAGGGYAVMAGGLARVASVANTRIISMQRGGASKDVWVQTHGPVSDFSLIKPSIGARDLVRAGANLTSRVVENLFWLGRYAERFDVSARLLRVALGRIAVAGGSRTPALVSAIELARRLGVLPEPAEDAPPRERNEHELLQAIYDPDQPGSLAGNIRSLMWSATHVRERLSLDHWHSLNALQRDQQRAQKTPPTLTEAIAFLDRVLLFSSSLTGFAMDNMTRDDGWRFLIIGRRLERLAFLAEALAGFLEMKSARGSGALDWLLDLMDSTITYRSRYSRTPELLPVLDLLVFDDSNPHGVLFQCQVLLRYLERLERELGTDFAGGLAAATAALRAFDLGALERQRFAECQPCEHCGDLAGQLTGLVEVAGQISDELSRRYFTHVGDIGRQTMAL